jgi:hypothetical protein
MKMVILDDYELGLAFIGNKGSLCEIKERYGEPKA